jgi:hypothetical protein
MAKTLNALFSFGGRRIVVKGTPREDEGHFEVVMELRSSIADGNVIYTRQEGYIRDGRSTLWMRGAVGTGESVHRALSAQQNAVLTASGFADLFATWRAAANKNARDQAIEDYVYANGLTDAGLAAT